MKTWTWKEVLQIELVDNAAETGGVSYQGEKLDNFLMESGMMSEKKIMALKNSDEEISISRQMAINFALVEAGILPIFNTQETDIAA
jgi:hypothetical protein